MIQLPETCISIRTPSADAELVRHEFDLHCRRQPAAPVELVEL